MNPTAAVEDSLQEQDVTILGGGLAGLTLGLHCRQLLPEAKILILEKNRHPAPEAAFKVGESSVEVGAQYFAQVLGLKQHILAEQLPKLGLRFFFRAGDNREIQRRFELGGNHFPATASYQLDRGRFENFLGRRCRELGIEFLDGSQVGQVELGRGRRPHQLAFTRDDREINVKTRWVADASGRAGILKRTLGLAQPYPHRANAVWLRISGEINIDDWSSDADWKAGYGPDNSRWLSTNHLMGDGYWVWLIPLASGFTSVGIVADDAMHPLSTYNSMDKALAWLDRHEPQCAAKIRQQQSNIHDFLAVKDYAYQAKQVFSANRWGLVGEAGCFPDPFYSPGSDFIAFGNTLLATLIQRDLAGKTNLLHAPFYELIFQRFFSGTAIIYQDQYPLFGDHQLMPVKIAWDYMIYWTLTGFIQLHGRLADVSMYLRHWQKIKRLDTLNRSMQQFFIDWHEQSPNFESAGRFDLLSIPLVYETNRALTDQLDAAEFGQQFADNVAQIETLYWEIIDQAGIKWRAPFRRRTFPRAEQGSLQPLFTATTQKPSESGDLSPHSNADSEIYASQSARQPS